MHQENSNEALTTANFVASSENHFADCHDDIFPACNGDEIEIKIEKTYIAQTIIIIGELRTCFQFIVPGQYWRLFFNSAQRCC